MARSSTTLNLLRPNSRPGHCRRYGRRGESGQSLLEFALIFPVLFLLLVGVTFIAQGFNLQMVLYGAAYEGARAMARNPILGSGNYCSPPACNPDQGGSSNNFEVYVQPVVRQYLANNGFDTSRVRFYSKDERGYQNSLSLVSNNRQMVSLTLIYTIQLPLGNFAASFANVDVTASCTMKRGT
ncbi:MAG: pilus assembly protein [Acidobacteria bacterium]|nr:pilus assembly protein [Acidobacteriota bacterium]